ncbi:TonB-dependent receptor [Pelagibacterium sp. H642]|uniref:TonB-dependent receptor n=1 Tax=Pelagibacterium sp. H642 TaxID=1881069 RepID=UPI002816868E|nr:TonB-dependent receptor [Pelagibacterium sp. H642]WMT92582.1 TonB-dependent receptor [Pelagibacterium sp. H642]WMT92758.1 TonB-dependent receptor [Pelagibacterium sp. H642]WMT92878.1 TonB-dependent receptor [Pelagibacterium sp. H642]
MTSSRAKIPSRLGLPSWGLLSGSALTTGVLLAVPALAQTNPCPTGDCPAQVIGQAQYASQVGTLPIGENTEAESLADAGSIPFMISVDGDTVEESTVLDRPVDAQRRTDLGLSAVDIGVKFDGLDAEPVLNVVTEPRQGGGQEGDTISFATYANYPGFIARAEIRIHDREAGPSAAPVAIVPVAINGRAQWTVPAEAERFGYVLRVYDGRGAYDETLPAPLVERRAGLDASGRLETSELDEDRTGVRNISVYGGAVTVYGHSVPAGYAVQALGETIAVDAERAFVTQRILPPGDHSVDVALVGEGGKSALQFTREINIPYDDWFYVALADLTVGARTGDDMIEAVRPGEYDEVWSTGRLAFYLKGKIRGEYLLTAAADTGEEGLGHLFDRMGERNARDLLRGLDPSEYYPVYGDDSTIVEDAPTDGRFYLRLERGDSHVMWGNYQTAIEGTEFLRSDRTLYGANAVYRSEETTSFGERRTQATVYAALPDTLPQREEFQGTGGSAYFLRRQDVSVGSETLTVEVRDAVSGRVVQRRVLQYGVDYSIDYLQGVVILKSPLAWMTGTSGPVRDGAIGGNKVFLVAQYEFVPAADDLDGYAYGGRLQHWFGDHLRIGATGMSETTGPADQTGIGADIALRYSQTSFLEAEIARSEGPGFGLSHSVDGGLSWGEDGTAGIASRSAIAWRLAGQIDLADLGVTGTQGTVGAYYENKQEGFSTLTQQIHTDQWLWGLDADIAFENGVELVAGYDDYEDGEGQIKRNGDLSLAFQLDPYWNVSAGLSYTELMSPRAIASGRSGYDGSRLDAGVRIEHHLSEDTILHAFGQTTLATSGDIDRNDRAGVGAQVQLTDTVGLTGEISYGTHGLGALLGATYDPNADEHYYMGYRLDPARAFDIGETFDLIGDDGGTVVFGLKRRLDEIASTYAENSYDMYGNKRSLTQTYGVLLTPDSLWTVDLGLVAGRVEDSTTDPVTGLERADFNRYAPSLAISYVDEPEGIAAHARGEVRIEESSDGTRNQNTYLFATGLSWQTSDDWRLLADFDGVFSDSTSDNSAFTDTEYAEASIGYAYRPVEHDRLNALFRYTWLYDRPGGNQLISGVTGDSLAPAQRSHILSLDVNYDLMPWLTVGGKYGFRYGEVLNRATDDTGFVDDWHQSSAHLGVLRADVHVVKNWDLLLEGRVMHMPEAETTDYGALAAVYHHLGDNFKIGLGYNFGSFSDDLRDLTLNDRGVFLNLVGKF